MSDSQCGCVCCPNNCKSNGEIIAAQVLSIAAYVIAFSCWWAFFLLNYPWFEAGVMLASLVLMILYQVLYCVSIPKNLHWALIVPTFIISGCNSYTAIDWVGRWWLVSLCYWAQAVLWLVAAILELVFVFKKNEVGENTEDADNVDAGEDV